MKFDNRLRLGCLTEAHSLTLAISFVKKIKLLKHVKYLIVILH